MVSNEIFQQVIDVTKSEGCLVMDTTKSENHLLLIMLRKLLTPTKVIVMVIIGNHIIITYFRITSCDIIKIIKVAFDVSERTKIKFNNTASNNALKQCKHFNHDTMS